MNTTIEDREFGKIAATIALEHQMDREKGKTIDKTLSEKIAEALAKHNEKYNNKLNSEERMMVYKWGDKQTGRIKDKLVIINKFKRRTGKTARQALEIINQFISNRTDFRL